MSQRSRRLRRARPCYSCGFIGRHYRDNEGAESKADPCSCRACLQMPREWRSELREQYKRKIGDRAYHNKWEKRYGRPIDKSPIEPVELDVYAWPGGYQMMYYINGNPVCPKCIMKVLREEHFTGSDGILRDVFYEGAPENCTECGEEIESAYGDPDADEDDVEGNDTDEDDVEDDDADEDDVESDDTDEDSAAP